TRHAGEAHHVGRRHRRRRQRSGLLRLRTRKLTDRRERGTAMSGSSDNVWILGTYMTKFGRHGDKDLIDLASESAMGALKDANVAQKNHAHSTLNPLAHYQKQYALDEIMNAEMMSYPNTLLMCCPNTDGSAAVVLVSEEKLRTLSKEQQQRAVKISASVLTTDPWTEHAQVQPDVNTLTRNAAKQAYEAAGVGPEDLDLVELHDCFA